MKYNIKVVRGNDLYFPKGNEEGDYYEALWIAKWVDFAGQPRIAHGRSKEEAISNAEERNNRDT